MKKTNKTTVAGGIVFNKNKKIIIVNQNNNSWSLPKGHVENNETLIEAAKREIYEETGVKNLKFIKSLGYYQRYRIGLTGEDDREELKIIHIFLFFTSTIKLQPLDSHNPEAVWTTFKQGINLLTHKEDKRFLLKHSNTLHPY